MFNLQDLPEYSIFSNLELLSEDPAFGLFRTFQQDLREAKVDVCLGVYQDADGKTPVFTAVRKAENLILEQKLDKNYSQHRGDPQFLEMSKNLIFGKKIAQNFHLAASQSIGGSGALSLAAKILHILGCPCVFIPNPTWWPHQWIFEHAHLKVLTYPYYNFAQSCFDMSKACEMMTLMPPGSAMILHACCHNPTGADPSQEQWLEMAALMKKHHIIPIFDLAYQGYGSGLDEDAWVVRHFTEMNFELFAAVSFSKSFGLYGERSGVLFVNTRTDYEEKIVHSHIDRMIRLNYSVPPLHSARIVKSILESEALLHEWKMELSARRLYVDLLRATLTEKLMQRQSKRDFSFLLKQKGFFSFIGLNSEQVSRLLAEKAIYMLSNGRVNVPGLKLKSLDYFVEAVISVL